VGLCAHRVMGLSSNLARLIVQYHDLAGPQGQISDGLSRDDGSWLFLLGGGDVGRRICDLRQPCYSTRGGGNQARSWSRLGGAAQPARNTLPPEIERKFAATSITIHSGHVHANHQFPGKRGAGGLVPIAVETPMPPSFADAVTRCPACKQDVPLSARRCSHCNAPADTSSAFLGFRHPDGSAGMVDQLTLAYLRSPHSSPSQTDLDQLFANTTRVEIMELVFEHNVGSFKPRLEFTSRDDLSALRRRLEIDARPTGHLMTIGDVILAFYQAGHLVARVEIVGYALLRWPDRWKDDGALADPNLLADFLESRGFAKLRQSIDQRAKQTVALAAAHAAWLATWETATPAGLAPLTEDLSREIHAPVSKTRERAMALLAAHYPSIDHQILALLAWYGHGCGPWSGHPVLECAPESLLECFSAEQLVHALENHTLSRQHLEGAARFISRWVPEPGRKVQKNLIDRFRKSAARQQVLNYIQASKDPVKVQAMARILA
jgi:hypothetical protein